MALNAAGIDRVAARHLPSILAIALEMGRRTRPSLTRGLSLGFLDLLLQRAFEKAGFPRLYTPFAEPDGYPAVFRDWVRQVASEHGGFQTDWTDYPEARQVHDEVLRAPSVDALTSGQHVVRFPASQQRISPDLFAGWVAQGASSVAELAMDAASLIRDQKTFLETGFHAFAGGSVWSEADLDKEIEERIDRIKEDLLVHDPVALQEQLGSDILERMIRLAERRGVSLERVEKAVQQALARPSAQERGMSFRVPMPPLALVQAAWLYEAGLFGEFDEGHTLLASAEELLP